MDENMARAQLDQPPVRYRAAWFGGPPGQSFERLKKKLRAEGIDVLYREENYNGAAGLKNDVNLVLICKMMHEDAQTKAAIQLAIRNSVPYCITHTDWSNTRTRLMEKELISEPVDDFGDDAYEEELEIVEEPPQQRHLALAPPPPPPLPSETIADLIRSLHSDELIDLPVGVTNYLVAAQRRLLAHDRAAVVLRLLDGIDFTEEMLHDLLDGIGPEQAQRLIDAAHVMSQ